jgi:hypothetical protein
MSRKWVFDHRLVNGQAISGNFVSDPTVIKYVDRCGLRIVFDGTLTGVPSLEGSVDGQTFTDLNLNLEPMTANSHEYVIDMTQTALHSVRVAYTHTSGSGTLNVWIAGKES